MSEFATVFNLGTILLKFVPREHPSRENLRCSGIRPFRYRLLVYPTEMSDLYI